MGAFTENEESGIFTPKTAVMGMQVWVRRAYQSGLDDATILRLVTEELEGAKLDPFWTDPDPSPDHPRLEFMDDKGEYIGSTEPKKEG